MFGTKSRNAVKLCVMASIFLILSLFLASSAKGTSHDGVVLAQIGTGSKHEITTPPKNIRVPSSEAALEFFNFDDYVLSGSAVDSQGDLISASEVCTNDKVTVDREELILRTSLGHPPCRMDLFGIGSSSSKFLIYGKKGGLTSTKTDYHLSEVDAFEAQFELEARSDSDGVAVRASGLDPFDFYSLPGDARVEYKASLRQGSRIQAAGSGSESVWSVEATTTAREMPEIFHVRITATGDNGSVSAAQQNQIPVNNNCRFESVNALPDLMATISGGFVGPTDLRLNVEITNDSPVTIWPLNEGSDTLYSYNIFVSEDGQFSADDAILLAFPVNRECHNGNEALSITNDLRLPSNLRPGSYCIGVSVDIGSPSPQVVPGNPILFAQQAGSPGIIRESDETNNSYCHWIDVGLNNATREWPPSGVVIKNPDLRDKISIDIDYADSLNLDSYIEDIRNSIYNALDPGPNNSYVLREDIVVLDAVISIASSGVASQGHYDGHAAINSNSYRITLAETVEAKRGASGSEIVPPPSGECLFPPGRSVGCISPEPDREAACSIFGKYDDDGNNMVDDPELFSALDDWVKERLSQDLFFAFIHLWTFQEPVCFTSVAGSSDSNLLSADQLSVKSYGRFLRFQFTGLITEKMEVNVYDLDGRQVTSQTSNGNDLILSLNDRRGQVLPNGVYIYRVTSRTSSGKLLTSAFRKLVVLR